MYHYEISAVRYALSRRTNMIVNPVVRRTYVSDGVVEKEARFSSAQFPLRVLRLGSKSHQKTVELTLNALHAMFVLSHPNFFRIRIRGGKLVWNDVLRIRAAHRLFVWLLHNSSGPERLVEYVIPNLKAFSAWLRYLAIDPDLVLTDAPKALDQRFPFADKQGKLDIRLLLTGDLAGSRKSSSKLAAMSRVGRAFPPGLPKQISSSIDDHRSIVCNPQPCEPPKEFLKAYGTFVRAARVFTEVEETMSLHKSSDTTRRGRENTSNRFLTDHDLLDDAIAFPITSGWNSVTRDPVSVRHGGASTVLLHALFPIEQTRADAFQRDNWRYGIREGDHVSGFIKTGSGPFGELGVGFEPTVSLTLTDGHVVSAPDSIQEVTIENTSTARANYSKLFLLHQGLDLGPVQRRLELAKKGELSSRVVGIPDRGGFKTRVISVSDPLLQVSAQIVRRTLYKSLLSFSPTGPALRGEFKPLQLTSVQDAYENIINMKFLRSRPRMRRSLQQSRLVFLSADMKSATDFFPIACQQMFNAKFFKRKELATFPVQCWAALSVPQKLCYDYLEDDYDEQTCGSLMGTVPSWVHLNCLNWFEYYLAFALYLAMAATFDMESDLNIRSAFKKANPYRHQFESQMLQTLRSAKFQMFWRYLVFKPEFFRQLMRTVLLCGDDLEAICPAGVALIYELLIAVHGGSISPGKHFVVLLQKDKFAFGVFAECMFLLSGQPRLQTRVIGAPPLRLASSLLTNLSGKPGDWTETGQALQSLVRECSTIDMKRRLLRLAFNNLSPITKRLLDTSPRSVGLRLPLFLPSSLGGMGAPHPEGLPGIIRKLSAKDVAWVYVLRWLSRTNLILCSKMASQLRISWDVKLNSKFPQYLDQAYTLLSEWCSIRRDDHGAIGICEGLMLGFRGEEPTCSLDEIAVILASRAASVNAADLAYDRFFSEWDPMRARNEFDRSKSIAAARVRFARTRGKLLRPYYGRLHTLGHEFEFEPDDQTFKNIPVDTVRKWLEETCRRLEGLQLPIEGLRLLHESYPTMGLKRIALEL